MSKKVVLLSRNDSLRKFTGVTKFHEAGYYGSRVTAASAEVWSLTAYNPYNNVSAPLKDPYWNDHALNTAETFFQVAPLAKLVQLPTSSIDKGDGTFVSGFINDALPIIKELKISNMFNTLSTSYYKARMEAEAKAMKDLGFFKYFASAGNDDTGSYNKFIENEEIIAVASYHLDTGKPKEAYYSSESIHVDFAAPGLVYSNYKAEDRLDETTSRMGTSYSAPWLCGMACLVDDFFIDKTGSPLSKDNMIKFFMDNLQDIYTDGFDNKTGYGAVILPDPSTIDIDKYRSSISEIDQFNDKDLISSWAKDSVNKCIVNGFMNGKGNNMFDPKCSLTREEMACVLDRVYSKLENMINKYVL